MQRNYFTNKRKCLHKGIKPWNSIAQDVVEAKIVNAFKKGPDNFHEG